MKIGFIGTGRIAEACVRGLAGKGHDIYITERSGPISKHLASIIPEVQVLSVQQVVDMSETVCLALTQSVAEQILENVVFRKDQSVVSFMLGVNIARLHQMCAPAVDICITIPLPMIATGSCPLLVFPNSAALYKMYGNTNKVIILDSESALAPHFAATALVSTILSQLAVARAWLGEKTGSTTKAEAYLLSLMDWTFACLPKDGNGRISEALGSLATEGGLNAQLRKHMSEAGVEEALDGGLNILGTRLNI